MDLPPFESYFTVIRKFAYFIGLEPFRPDSNRKCFNWVMNFYGILMTANQLFYTVCFFTFLSKATKVLEIISHIPFILFCIESWLRFIFMRYYRNEITNLVEEFRQLYTIPWDSNRKVLQELKINRLNFVRVQYFYLMCNIVFCAGAILVSLYIYVFLQSMDLLFIVNTWMPFDRYKYAWIVFILDTNTARYAQYGNTVPDIVLGMLLIQLNYHLESLGYAIQNIIRDSNIYRNRDKKEFKRKFMGKLKDVAFLHNKLTE